MIFSKLLLKLDNKDIGSVLIRIIFFATLKLKLDNKDIGNNKDNKDNKDKVR